ncbi:hypothetical protein M407DRAFT_140874 [Tulasnella calospora MUT 4182]|uniref:CFEM domain-containing protein n=1 Tax=Tulasnella calospora MUT 4182 TaxID=1051891 RepID=A0A0C3KCB7_9AGAM|nr:hypothetical protein M407DRAFT_150451 [Tulasnella calospora MUT 4182]KIO20051.1 hypothetical protein M407DRAFT_140874 [Tulasnella calospora MUT 4182]
MHFSLVVLFAASLVSALTIIKRGIDGPECAVACEAKSNPSPCDREDTACLCLNIGYITSVSDCVRSSCSPEDAKAAALAEATYCNEAGINEQNPFPSCGAQCAQIAPFTNCAENNGACLCKNGAYMQAFVKCIHDFCTGEDLESASLVGEALCRAYGVDIPPFDPQQ